MPTSNAHQFFASLKAEADLYQALSSYPGSTPAKIETEWCDFKGCERIDHKAVSKLWSTAISGFGNTEGGVLIWGLDARKDPTSGIDQVGGLSLASDAAALSQRLRELLIHASDPPVQGIEILPVAAPEKKEGFVVCFVPEGQFKPHRAELSQKRFYIRAGDNFIVPSVALLRNLFYPTAAAFLRPIVRTRQAKDANIEVKFSIGNTGTATADDVFLILEHPPKYNFLPTMGDNVRKPVALHAKIPLSLKNSINPGLSETIIGLQLTLAHGWEIEDVIVFRAQVFCRDAIPRKWSCALSYHDLIKNGRKEFVLDE